jgi:hypothetical protein
LRLLRINVELRATLHCNGFNLCPERNLSIQKRVSGGTILNAFIRVTEIVHGRGALPQTLCVMYNIELIPEM